MTRCFVIGPIGNKFDPVGSPGRETWEEALQVFESVIRPACQSNGLDPIRADQIALAGEITEQVFRHLFEDEVVIADVSGGNPNVMYELGLRHTRDLLTIQIGEYGQLPFDVTAIRSILFSRSERGLIDARKQLERALALGLAEGADPVTATRVWSAGLASQSATVASGASDELVGLNGERVEGLEDAEDAEGFLERLAVIEDTFPRMSSISERIIGILEQLGSDAEVAGREINLLNESQAPAKERLVAVARFANVLQPSADALTEATDAFAGEMATVNDGVTGVLRHLELDPTAGGEDVDFFLDNLIGLAQTSRDAMEGIGQFGGIVASLGSVSKTLRRPGKQMSEAVRRMATSTAVMDEWEASVRRIISARSGPDAAATSAPAG